MSSRTAATRAEVMLADVLSVYLDEKALGTADPQTTVADHRPPEQLLGRQDRLRDQGASSAGTTRQQRGTESGARKDLEFLRAAVNYYHERARRSTPCRSSRCRRRACRANAT